jgi:hypothetical protein
MIENYRKMKKKVLLNKAGQWLSREETSHGEVASKQ